MTGSVISGGWTAWHQSATQPRVFAFVVTAVVLAGIVFGIAKGWYTQAILIGAGFALLGAGAVMGISPIVVPNAAGGIVPTGYDTFDLFERLRGTFSYRAAGIGMNIMAVGGFAKHMSRIGASDALVRVALVPISAVKKPYLVIAFAYVVGALLNMFITSATGLGLLLMATMYPVLRGLGISKLTAAAAIATTGALELGPTHSAVIYAAEQAGLDIATYLFDHQLPVAIPTMFAIAALHVGWQSFMDRRDGTPPTSETTEDASAAPEAVDAPGYYALLTTLPLVFVIWFSKLTGATYTMHIVTAILLSVSIAMLVHAIRRRSLQAGIDSLESFMDGMGAVFASVVTLVVAAGVFADGLKQIGVIETILDVAQGAGFGATQMVLVIVLVIVVTSVLMGSGNAAFLAFGELVPSIAARFGVSAASMLLPIQISSSLARTFSPITAAVIAVAGLADVSPFALVRRTVVPMVGGMVVLLVLSALH